MIRETIVGADYAYPAPSMFSTGGLTISVFEDYRGHVTDHEADLKALRYAIGEARLRYRVPVAVVAHASLVRAVGRTEFRVAVTDGGASWRHEWPPWPTLFRLTYTVDHTDLLTGRVEPRFPQNWASAYYAHQRGRS